MKTNVNNNKNRLAQTAFLACGILVAGAAALGVGNYKQTLRELEMREHDALVLDRLGQAARFNILIRELNSGKSAEARHYLNVALADDIAEAKVLAADANPGTVAQATCTVGLIERDENAHPDYYAIKWSPSAPASSTIQVARHMPKQ